jgi:hypothetical protein
MAAVKTSFTATGTSEVVFAHQHVLYHADFTTGTGVGTAQLQCMLGGDWVPADVAITATMESAEVADCIKRMAYRWNVSAYTSGTITLYLDSDLNHA